MIKYELEKYKNHIVFFLVAKCEQYKLKFFSTLGFVPIKLRKTGVGTHCIMCYPYKENSEKLCQRLFDYFNWREKKRNLSHQIVNLPSIQIRPDFIGVIKEKFMLLD